MLTEEQQRIRDKGVGSSEVAMLIPSPYGGWLSPWGGPHTLWRRKTGQEAPQEETSAMSRGQFFEPAIANWYAHDHVVHVRQCKTIVHPRCPQAIDTCDYTTHPVNDMRDDNVIACLEIKAITAQNRHEWGEPGTDEVPLHYAVQAQWHLGFYDVRECWLPVDNGYGRSDYLVLRDEELFEGLLATVQKFWRDHIIGGREPAADGSDETSRWLSQRFVADRIRPALVTVAPDDDLAKLLYQYRDLCLKLDPIAETKSLLENQIKQAIGDAEGIEIAGTKQRITYKAVQGRQHVAWEKMLLELCETQKQRDEIKQRYTERGAPYRRLEKRGLMNHE